MNLNYIVLFGPPGAGKGTQTSIIAEKFDYPGLATGDLFRSNMSAHSPLGDVAQEYIARGELVPDEVTIDLVRNQLLLPKYKRGAILDGFPRTIKQARALSEISQENGFLLRVLFIKVPEEILVERISGRIICEACGQVNHLTFNPPAHELDPCPIGGEHKFYQREDDSSDIVTNRIRIYQNRTMPLLKYFEEEGSLVVVDGTQEISKVTADLVAALEVQKA